MRRLRFKLLTWKEVKNTKLSFEAGQDSEFSVLPAPILKKI